MEWILDDKGMAEEMADPIGQLAIPQMKAMLARVLAERIRQDKRWGYFRDFPDGTGGLGRREGKCEARRDCQLAAKSGRSSWGLVFAEAVAGVMAEPAPAALVEELIRAAAVAVAWAEAIGRRSDKPPNYLRKPGDDMPSRTPSATTTRPPMS